MKRTTGESSISKCHTACHYNNYRWNNSKAAKLTFTVVFREVPRRHLVSNLIPVAKNLFLSEESRLSTRSRREGKPMASEEKLVVL